jgi:hypothetical protein
MNPLARWLMTFLFALPLMAAAEAPKSQQPQPAKTYSQDEVLKAAEDFFGTGAQGLAKVIEKAFKDQGEPMAIIRGEEASGAIGVGLRYGHGRLVYKGSSGAGTKVYWQGPSIGFDFGANAAKTFVLVYNLPSTDALFQRYPGVEGSLYFVGGFGLHYVQSDKTVLAPVRFGLGWRQGVGVGYMHFSRKKRYNPF